MCTLNPTPASVAGDIGSAFAHLLTIGAISILFFKKETTILMLSLRTLGEMDQGTKISKLCNSNLHTCINLPLLLLSCWGVWLFVTPWTVACQAPLSMGFPRQEYSSGLPFASPGINFLRLLFECRFWLSRVSKWAIRFCILCASLLRWHCVLLVWGPQWIERF